MDKISERLLGSFNIEMVVRPIDLKISEAIMNFQENGADVSQRIFTGCGKPILGKRRRSVTLKNILEKNTQKDTSSDDIEFEGSDEVKNDSPRNTRGANKDMTYVNYKFKNEAGSGGGKANKNSKQHSSSLEKLIRDIKHAVKDSKRIWSHLPYQICNNEDFADGPSKEDDCWNGTAVAK